MPTRSPKAETGHILFIQGGGEGTYDQWDNRLVDSLRDKLGLGFDIRYPRMPNEDEPDFAAWSAAIEREIDDFGSGGILVGHSLGAAFLIHLLAKKPALLTNIASIHLIATPFIGEGGWPNDDIAPGPGWADTLAGANVNFYWGDSDDTVPASHLDLYAKALPQARLHRLAGRDHQLSDDLSEVAEEIRRAR